MGKRLTSSMQQLTARVVTCGALLSACDAQVALVIESKEQQPVTAKPGVTDAAAPEVLTDAQRLAQSVAITATEVLNGARIAEDVVPLLQDACLVDLADEAVAEYFELATPYTKYARECAGRSICTCGWRGEIQLTHPISAASWSSELGNRLTSPELRATLDPRWRRVGAAARVTEGSAWISVEFAP